MRRIIEARQTASGVPAAPPHNYEVVADVVPQPIGGRAITRLTGKPARDKVTGALVEEQPIEGIPAASKGEHTGSADDQTSA